jgi:hypothetical protein
MQLSEPGQDSGEIPQSAKGKSRFSLVRMAPQQSEANFEFNQVSLGADF